MLTGRQVDLDGVVDTDGGVWVSDPISTVSANISRQSLVQRLIDVANHVVLYSRARVMRNQEWDAALAQLDSLDLAQLVLGLFSGDAVDGEATLGVVDEAEVLASLLDANNIHEAGRVGWVSADLAVDLDQALHDDGLGLAGVEGVLQTVAEDLCQHLHPNFLPVSHTSPTEGLDCHTGCE